ncbi:MAG: tetratricopeptide repeat protein [Acidobacteriota bacterium]
MAYHIILYTTTGNVLDRQVIPNNGRYRFSNVRNGEYDVGVEVDGMEIGRVRVTVQSLYKTDFQHDLGLELKPGFSRPSKGSVVSAADFYERQSLTKGLFENADRALSTKNYDEALTLLKRVVEIDPIDFQAWTQLGTVYLGLKKFDEADSSYSKAIEIRPSFFPALLNLGRLRLMTQKYEAAVDVLTQAITQRKDSADANFYLGEAYLQVKKGTLGARYLYEAIRLDPVGQADAHLRLATLYNAAGMKGKAAVEYQEFLRKKPDYPERKKLEKYIADNNKP